MKPYGRTVVLNPVFRDSKSYLLGWWVSKWCCSKIRDPRRFYDVEVDANTGKYRILKITKRSKKIETQNEKETLTLSISTLSRNIKTVTNL